MANLRVNLDTAVYTVLNVQSVVNEATGGVFNLQAPQGAEPPFIVLQAMSKVDDYWSFTGGRGAQLSIWLRPYPEARGLSRPVI